MVTCKVLHTALNARYMRGYKSTIVHSPTYKDNIKCTMSNANCKLVNQQEILGGPAIEMDPTNSLITALTDNVPHQPRATAQNNTTVLQYLRGLQPSVSNCCVSSIPAEHTTSQTFCPPLPSSVQFDNNSDAGHVFKPTVSLASCDMTLSVSTKQLKALVTGCVKQQLVWRFKFFDNDLHGQFDHHPDSGCRIINKTFRSMC
jgi:hypothetical protein